MVDTTFTYERRRGSAGFTLRTFMDNPVLVRTAVITLAGAALSAVVGVSLGYYLMLPFGVG